MEFAPIAGIRAVSLQNLQKSVDRSAPRFEIEASERSGDETYSSGQQQAPNRGLEDEEEDAQTPETEDEEGDAETPELVASDGDSELHEGTPDGRLDWFV